MFCSAGVPKNRYISKDINEMDNSFFKEGYLKLADYCQKESFKGYDPFDGLNSRLFVIFPFLKKSSLFKLAWIQFFKRCPVNFRKIAGIKKEYNPKGLGLFLSGYCNLYKTCLLYTSPSPRDGLLSRMPSSA